MPHSTRAARNARQNAYRMETGRKKPQLFPPCSQGRHDRCAFTVHLAGHLSMRCLCPCHKGQSTHENSDSSY